jgi:hypothetical protein
MQGAGSKPNKNQPATKHLQAPLSQGLKPCAWHALRHVCILDSSCGSHHTNGSCAGLACDMLPRGAPSGSHGMIANSAVLPGDVMTDRVYTVDAIMGTCWE